MRRKLLKAIKKPKRCMIFLVSTLYNLLIDLKHRKKVPVSGLKEFNEVAKKSAKRTDINDHLTALFTEALEIKPRLIVELGVRGGESTFVLERVAKLCDAHLVSVDIADCSGVSNYTKWHFIRKDDVEFAKTFRGWCKKNRIKAEIDVLYIDTSHLFEHTAEEIICWFPFLSPKSKVFFHDTNLREVFFRKDGSMGFGWDNKRGVIRALEHYFSASFREDRKFVDVKKGFIISHYPWCNGFTVLKRINA